MANYESIIPWILYQEDSHKEPGKTVDLGDGAGMTRLGLTQRWHQTDLPMDFFGSMPLATAIVVAKAAYRKIYWNHFNGDLIFSDDIAAPILSFAVNDGVKEAVEAVQKVLGVVVDGVMGPKTIAELNSKDPMVAAKMYRAEWLAFYQHDIAMNPNKKDFFKGWVNRVNFPWPADIPELYK